MKLSYDNVLIRAVSIASFYGSKGWIYRLARDHYLLFNLFSYCVQMSRWTHLFFTFMLKSIHFTNTYILLTEYKPLRFECLFEVLKHQILPHRTVSAAALVPTAHRAPIYSALPSKFTSAFVSWSKQVMPDTLGMMSAKCSEETQAAEFKSMSPVEISSLWQMPRLRDCQIIFFFIRCNPLWQSAFR